MTFIYGFHLYDFISKIICLITILEFLSFIYVTSKLSISFNHAKYLKGLLPYYILLLFIKNIFKTLRDFFDIYLNFQKLLHINFCIYNN